MQAHIHKDCIKRKQASDISKENQKARNDDIKENRQRAAKATLQRLISNGNSSRKKVQHKINANPMNSTEQHFYATTKASTATTTNKKKRSGISSASIAELHFNTYN